MSEEQQAQVPAVRETGELSTGNLSSKQSELIKQAIESNVDESELQISRLALMQPQSPEITNEEMGYRPGQIVDNITREIYTSVGKPPWLLDKVPADELKEIPYLIFVPIFKLPEEFIKWIPKNEQKDNEMWEFKELDVNDPRVRDGIWAPRGRYKGDKPPVTTNLNVLGLVVDENGLAKSSYIVATFARTSYNTGRNLVTLCKQHGLANLPYWGRTYYLFSKKESREIGGSTSVYYIYNVAKGPLTNSLNPLINEFAGQFALWLADKEHGRERQESLINRAAFAAEDIGGEGSEGSDDDPFSSSSSDGKDSGGEEQF